MIGGYDIVIPTRATAPDAMAFCLRAIKRSWPGAVIDDAETGEEIAENSGEFLPDFLREAFVYRDRTKAKEWRVKGAEPCLANTMIHILTGDGRITAVVDNPRDKGIRSILEAIRSGLQMDIFNIGPEQGVAA